MPLKSRLPQVARDLNTIADAICERTGNAMRDVRNQTVRVDTGALRDSEKLERRGRGAWVYGEGYGLPDARAAYTNYGTYKMAADGHFDNAVEAGRKAMPAIARDEVKRATGGL